MNDIVRGLEAEQAASSASGFTWPMPPYFECCATIQPVGPEPCRVRASLGIEFNCRLIAFCATDPFLTLQEVDSPTTRSIKQDEVKLLRLLRPLRLKRHDAGISGLENVVLPFSDTQAFTIEYGDGEVLRGDTAGYIDDRYGVFFFEPVTGGMVERCFAPRAAVRRFTLGAPVGEMLVADSKLGRDKIQAAIREQEQLRGQRLGELLAEEGAVSREEISAALKRQKNMPVMRLGEFLRESKIISDAQLEAALARQAENRRVPLGEILALREGALPPDDRLIQLVGEFEADVNNGGFGQYLSNKGAARAREALECLSAIGAKRTTRWLTSALEGRLGKDGLARLDQQFNEKAEDLASLATTYIGRRQ